MTDNDEDLFACRDCYWVGDEDELKPCCIQHGADFELTCPDCGSDWVERLEEMANDH